MSILTTLTKRPNSTAKELGVTNVQMVELENQGKVVRTGFRKTNKRGRPPVEWAVAGYQAPVVEAPVPVVEEPEEPAYTLPTLPEMSEEVRANVDPGDDNALRYIEQKIFNTDKPSPSRELADYKLMRERYLDIMRRAQRRAGRHPVVVPEEEVA